MIKINFIYSKQALKSLNKIPTNIKILIIKSINNIPNGDIKNMKGFSDNRKRLRVGKYRVIYMTNEETNDILILNIGNRGDIYK